MVLVAAVACSPGAATGPEESPAADLEPAPIETPVVAAYFPAPETSGGWRRLVAINATPTAQQKADIRSISGLDWDLLKQAWDGSSQYGGSFIVIRNGWVAAEFGTTSAMAAASCTKTLTSLTVHRMFELSAAGALGSPIGPDDFAYQYLPASWASDERRRLIQVRHLLNMSSGLVPDDNPPAPSSGTSGYQQKLLAPGVRTAPGQEWIYSSLPVDVLSLVTTTVTGIKLSDFFQQQLGSVIGVTTLKWASLGSHTYASAYATVTGRDLARIMYLLLQRGTWNGTSLVSGERIDAMTQWDPSLANAVYGPQVQFPTDPASQLRYGRLTWTNRTQSSFVGSGVPADAYYCAGFKTNFATVIPSLDLVIVRLQSGPTPWGDAVFKNINSKVVSAVVTAGGSNAPPTAQITTPTAGASFPAGDPITIAAISTDADGNVIQVEFFANGAPIASVATPPYNFAWTDAVPGAYSLTARSTDDLGATKTSDPVSITVTAAPPGNSAPSARITSPADGASFLQGGNVAISADATDADGTVTRVEFFAGSTLVGTDTAAPYGVTWSSVPAGSYSLTARSTDDAGASTTSAAVSIIVTPPSSGNQPPTVQITSPANGATYRARSNITLAAAASDPDGAVAKVTFYAGTNHLYTDTTAPYGFTWRSVAAGSYKIMARATDNLGKKTSATVNIRVTN